MTLYQTLSRKIETLRSENAGKPAFDFACDLGYIVGSAEENANDTVYVEKTEADWDRIFVGSLEMLLGDCRDPKVTSWFRKQGVTW